MGKLRYRLIPQGRIDGRIIPLNIVYVDIRDISAAGLSQEQAIRLIAQSIDGPAGINLFDMEAVTTTSDGIMVEGAIVRMAASDRGRINPDFGMLTMAEIPYSQRIVEEEPHLIQWQKRYPGRRLFRGPDPRTKIIPVHNVVITGRASNNNSATEMMNIITMEEIILPILGQLQCMLGGPVIVGNVGQVISVGIGMTVAEEYGRVFPTRQFSAGDTAHGSGIYAQTLKEHIPCIVADKGVLARYIIQALQCGCVPARHISCSPAVLAVAKHLGHEIPLASITSAAMEELESVGITRDYLREKIQTLSPEEIIRQADRIIPGVNGGVKHDSTQIVQVKEIGLD